MKNNNSSRRFFMKQLAISTAGIAIGTNVLAINSKSVPLKSLKQNSSEAKFTPFNRGNNTPSVNPDPLTQISWNTLRGHFRMSFNLDPSVESWHAVKRESPVHPTGEYMSGDYLLTISEKDGGKQTSLINYELTRAGGQPFRMIECHIECKTSYSGVYKIFTPGMMVQQNYHVDLPFRINDIANAKSNQPVIWMQQTDGRNTLTLGLLDQVAITTIEGSTYDTGNGGEAPGIANSYVRIV